MELTDAGESRIRGYLYILERSLATFLPAAEALDAAREVESHIRDRVADTAAVPDARTALEAILAELGPPLRVARAYSLEMAAEDALVSGRIIAILRSLLSLAALGTASFFAVLGLFVGYTVGAAFVLMAPLKAVFPNNTGLWTVNGIPVNLGMQMDPPAGGVLVGGWWVIAACVICGILLLWVTHRGARRLLRAWLDRRAARRALTP